MPLSDLHILVVDDDSAFLELSEALLRSLGVKFVTRAVNGADAYAKLTATNRATDRVVDCILCDYSMKNGNGLQLLQAIRLGQVKYFRADACFVLVTATADAAVVGMAAQLDVHGALVKPLTKDKLAATINKARERYFTLNPAKYAQVQVPEI